MGVDDKDKTKYSPLSGGDGDPGSGYDSPRKDHEHKEHSSSELKRQNRRIYKNLFVLSVEAALLSLAYHGLSWLQSVLFMVPGLGTTCQGIVHFTMVFSALLLPRLAIVKLGQKWTIVVCSLVFMLWMGANAVADWYTLSVTSVLVGVAAGPHSTAHASYITKHARLYASLNEQDPQHAIAMFFGMYGATHGMFKILSGVSSAYILSPGINVTVYDATEEDLAMCGRNDCPYSNVSAAHIPHNKHYRHIEQSVLWTLVAVYLLTAALSVFLTAVFLEPVPDDLQDPVRDTSSVWRETLELLTATGRLIAVPPLVLLIPLYALPGFDFAFYHADWARSYVTCALGVAYIGWTAIPQAVVNIPASLLGGFLTKTTGRVIMILTGLSSLIVVNLLQVFWMPRPEHMEVFYIVSSLYGLWAISNPAKDSLVGTEFPDNMDAVFAFAHMWSGLGGSLAFVYSSYLCARTKLYVLIVMISLAVTGYLAAEVLFRIRGRKGKYEQLETEEDVGEEKGEIMELKEKVTGLDEIEENEDESGKEECEEELEDSGKEDDVTSLR